MPAIVVTGDKKLDRALAKFEAKVQRGFVRKALNNSIKIVERDYKDNVPIGTDDEGNDTAVMRDATKRKTPKRKRGQQARSLVIDRDRLMTLYFQRYGRFPGKRRIDSEPFFYPAVIELGGSSQHAQRPLRAALYGNESQVNAQFINELRDAVDEAGKK